MRLNRIILAAVVFGVIVLIILLLLQDGRDKVNASGKNVRTADTVVIQPGPGQGVVQAQMENVNYRIDSSIILQIKKLRGELIASGKENYPVFDKKDSYYFEQLTAGYHITAKDDGLIIYMPDYSRL